MTFEESTRRFLPPFISSTDSSDGSVKYCKKMKNQFKLDLETKRINLKTKFKKKFYLSILLLISLSIHPAFE